MDDSNSNIDYFKRKQEIEALDIFEQIKKQSEDLSTSEASITLLKNLSNPTNLTKPQIIGPKKIKIDKNRKNKIFVKKIKISDNENIRKQLFLSKESMNNNNETKDEEKSLSIQKTLSRVNLSNIVNSDTQNNTMLTNRVLLDPIWNKLYPFSTKNGDDKTKKETTSEGRKKEKKVKIVDYINKSREILAMKFNIKNKLKRFQNLKNLKNNQINILDKLRQNFVNSKNYISENYHSNYISYLHHINQIIEDETIIANKIVQEKLKLKKK